MQHYNCFQPPLVYLFIPLIAHLYLYVQCNDEIRRTLHNVHTHLHSMLVLVQSQ